MSYMLNRILAGEIITGFLKHRLELGLSPEQVLRYIVSMDLDRLQKLEAGEAAPRTFELIALSTLYGVDRDELNHYYAMAKGQ
jgi:hypothetical protein